MRLNKMIGSNNAIQRYPFINDEHPEIIANNSRSLIVTI